MTWSSLGATFLGGDGLESGVLTLGDLEGLFSLWEDLELLLVFDLGVGDLDLTGLGLDLLAGDERLVGDERLEDELLDLLLELDPDFDFDLVLLFLVLLLERLPVLSSSSSIDVSDLIDPSDESRLEAVSLALLSMLRSLELSLPS